MYWIPAIFVLGELLFFMNLPSLMKDLAFNAFLKDLNKEREKEKREEMLKNNNMWSNITNQKSYPKIPEEKSTTITGLYYLSLLIYFVIGLFYPIWWLSVIIFSLLILSIFISKLIGQNNWKIFLDLTEFDEKLIPQKLERKIKLMSIDNNYKGIRIAILTKEYLFSIIRMVVCIAVIVLHQYDMLNIF